jgi:hypothetical protein
VISRGCAARRARFTAVITPLNPPPTTATVFERDEGADFMKAKEIT